MNRQGHSNETPSFWAATNYVDPWSFLKNDPRGYRHLLETDQNARLGDMPDLLSSFAQSNARNTFKRSSETELDKALTSLDPEKNFVEDAKEIIRKKHCASS